jgi:hypothetical protein
VDELSAKAAPAEMLRILAGALGGTIGVVPAKDKIGITVAFAALGDV